MKKELNKKGAMSDHITEILLLVVLLLLVLLAIALISGKGIELLSGIKSVFHFSR